MLSRARWTGALVAVLLVAQSVSAKPQKHAKQDKPYVEVVFVLDTTGSMGGLIEGAKQKIWSICNQVAAGKPTPDLKVGLVAYRDRGDDYITKVFDLTDDLDAVHEHLMAFQANGGGDEPESVNEALQVGIQKISWNKDDATLRIMFLVGDAPPHMDYANDIKYPVSCEQACRKGIIINTIQCGSSAETTRYWKEICTKAEGKFVQIAQDGGMAAITTPYDGRLAEINSAMASTTVVWGDTATQAESAGKVMLSAPSARCVDGIAAGGAGAVCAGCAPPPPACAPCSSAPIAADRAGYCAKTGRVATYDLLDSIKDGKVKLEELKADQLPDDMRKMTAKERQEHLAKIEKEREKLRAEALDLDKKRSDFIQKKMAEDKNHTGFDAQVLDMLRDEAKKYQIAY
jgi:Mg-chelatase subunit ChlD